MLLSLIIMVLSMVSNIISVVSCKEQTSDVRATEASPTPACTFECNDVTLHHIMHAALL